MSVDSGDKQQQKVREFMSLMPLTLAVAGLPPSDPVKHYNEDQMEVRASTIRTAYKIARQIILDIAK